MLVDNFSFEEVDDFKYFNVGINIENNMHREINERRKEYQMETSAIIVLTNYLLCTIVKIKKYIVCKLFQDNSDLCVWNMDHDEKMTMENLLYLKIKYSEKYLVFYTIVT